MRSNRVLVASFLAVVVYLAESSAQPDIASASMVAAPTPPGGLVAAGEILVMDDDEMQAKYWYWELNASGKTTRVGTVDVPQDHDPLLSGIAAASTGGIRVLESFTGRLWTIDAGGKADYSGKLMDERGELRCLRALSDGSTLVGGNLYKEETDTLNTDGVLMKHDADGELVWRREYDFGEQESVDAILALPDGTLVLAVSSGKWSMFGVGEGRGILLHCDAEGVVRDEARIAGGQSLARLAAAGDRVYYTCARAFPDESGKQNESGVTLYGFSQDLKQLSEERLKNFEFMLVFTPALAGLPGGRIALAGTPASSANAMGRGFRIEIRAADGSLEKELAVPLSESTDSDDRVTPGIGVRIFADDTRLVVVTQTNTFGGDGSMDSGLVAFAIRREDWSVEWRRTATLTRDGLKIVDR